MTTTINEKLSRRIEQVIQDYLAESQRVAGDAVARAFARANGRVHRSRQPRDGGQAGKYRPSAEIAELGGRLYEAVCQKPGEAMAMLAAGLGVTPRELERPMAQLKRTGQVRGVGRRNFMRYFPMAPKS